MNPHFFTAPFYYAFIWFRVQGSGLSWRLRRLFLEDGIPVSQPSPLGNAIKLSGRTFLAPHRGELPEGVVQANWIFRSEATRKSSETPFRTK